MCANLYIYLTIYRYSRDAYQYILLLSIYSKQFFGFFLILNNANVQKNRIKKTKNKKQKKKKNRIE